MSSSNPFDNVGNNQFLESYGSNEITELLDIIK